MDELVKRLRAAAKEWRKKNKVVGVGETRYDFALDEAANVIGELSFDLQSMQELNIALYGALPRWIPVTERKPKTDDIVIVAIHDDSGDTPYDVTNVGFYLDCFPIGVWVVENERCSYVTHWMQLPEPPKEET